MTVADHQPSGDATGPQPLTLPTLPSRRAVEVDPDPMPPAIYDELAARYGDPLTPGDTA